MTYNKPKMLLKKKEALPSDKLYYADAAFKCFEYPSIYVS